VALKRSSQSPSAWSHSQRSTGTLSLRSKAKASQQSEASYNFQFPWARISRSRTRSSLKRLTVRTATVPSGDGIVPSVRRLIESSTGCAISDATLRCQPVKLGKRLVGTKEGEPYTDYRSMSRKPRSTSRAKDGIQATNYSKVLKATIDGTEHESMHLRGNARNSVESRDSRVTPLYDAFFRLTTADLEGVRASSSLMSVGICL